MESLTGYDAWKLMTPEEDRGDTGLPVYNCKWCDEDIYEGDKYVELKSDVICRGCLEEMNAWEFIDGAYGHAYGPYTAHHEGSIG